MKKMSSHKRLMTALKRGVPDRVPCFPFLIRWTRYHHQCACPLHQLKVAEEFGFDAIIYYGAYTSQTVSNDYIYAPGGGYNHTAAGVYGDMPDVKLELRVENSREHVYYYRTFHTPAGTLQDAVQWSRPNLGYGDGPNPHRLEPLIKSVKDLDALVYLYPSIRRDMIADIPLMLDIIGERAVLAALDCVHAGSWGLESLELETRLLSAVENPELLKGVCRVAQTAHLRNLKAMLEEGIRVVIDSWFQIGPSCGWSPVTYRDIFLPLVKECAALTHEYDAVYIYQDDGRMTTILPFIVEAGVDVIGALQPPEVGDVILKNAKRQFGDKVALLGGLDPCYTLERGTPDDVRRAVKQAIEDAGCGGGYILGTGEAVDPHSTPIENLHAMVSAAQEYGCY